MKTKLLALLSLIASIWACTDHTQQYAVRIVIDRSTTERDLADIIEKAQADHIAILVDDAKYNERGTLNSIKGRVEFPDNGSAWFTSEKVGKIIIAKETAADDSAFALIVKPRWL